MEQVLPSRLNEIIEYRARCSAQGRATIAQSLVLDWLSDQDVEVLGAAYHTVSTPQFREGIAPPLSPEALQSFYQAYFARCIKENPQGTWVNGRYSAGWDLVGVMLMAFQSDRRAFERWKAFLGELYRQGGPEVRLCIENATIEHLFENPDVRAAFSDWANDKTLAVALQAGTEWVNEGGGSPLDRLKPK